MLKGQIFFIECWIQYIYKWAYRLTLMLWVRLVFMLLFSLIFKKGVDRQTGFSQLTEEEKNKKNEILFINKFFFLFE